MAALPSLPRSRLQGINDLKEDILKEQALLQDDYRNIEELSAQIAFDKCTKETEAEEAALVSVEASVPPNLSGWRATFGSASPPRRPS